MSEGVFDAEEASALKRAYEHVMAVSAIDPVSQPEAAKRLGRTLLKVFRARGAETKIDDLAHAAMLQFQADSAPAPI